MTDPTHDTGPRWSAVLTPDARDVATKVQTDDGRWHAESGEFTGRVIGARWKRVVAYRTALPTITDEQVGRAAKAIVLVSAEKDFANNVHWEKISDGWRNDARDYARAALTAAQGDAA